MIQQLVIFNMPGGPLCPHFWNESLFILNTCQRNLAIGLKGEHYFPELSLQAENFECFKGIGAYAFILKVICGLESKVLAEHEVGHQFKMAYAQYLKNPQRNPYLVKIFQKLLHDAKKVRQNFLKGISSLSYGAIARKLIQEKGPCQKVLVLGSGALAKEVIVHFKGKSDVFLSARNQEKVSEITNKHAVKTINWQKFQQYSDFSHIINTIGTKDTIFNQDFFLQWDRSHRKKGLFIDLGSPSSIHTPLQAHEGVMRLSCVLEKGQSYQQYNKIQIKKAYRHIQEISQKRVDNFRVIFKKDFMRIHLMASSKNNAL